MQRVHYLAQTRDIFPRHFSAATGTTYRQTQPKPCRCQTLRRSEFGQRTSLIIAVIARGGKHPGTLCVCTICALDRKATGTRYPRCLLFKLFRLVVLMDLPDYLTLPSLLVLPIAQSGKRAFLLEGAFHESRAVLCTSATYTPPACEDKRWTPRITLNLVGAQPDLTPSVHADMLNTPNLVHVPRSSQS